MTGVLNVLAACAAAGTVSVTVGSGSGNHGYNGGFAIGSASPASVLGISINLLASIDSSTDFRFALSGLLHSQSIFRYLIVRDGTGTFRKYNSADATYVSGSGQTTWSWGDGSNRVWTASDASEVHVVQFFR